MEILEKLNGKSKQELISLLEGLIENGTLQESDLQEYLMPKKMSVEEIEIITKAKVTPNELSESQITYINERLGKKVNVKCETLLLGTDKFLASMVELKINKYFALCYSKYPKKVGKELAKKSFLKLAKDFKYKDLDKNLKMIYGKVMRYAEHCIENDKEEQYILHFSTWLNGKRYNDQIND